MNILPITKINFKGYDAVPLKHLHLADFMTPYFPELTEISKKEGFTIETQQSNFEWLQDTFEAIDKNGKVEHYKNDKLAGDPDFIAGGNMYIGKYPNGEKWMLLGRNDTILKSKKQIADKYNIKPENIIIMPQADYHLDMFIRPVGYPYVLINDPALVKKELQKLPKGSKDYRKLYENYEKHEYSASKVKALNDAAKELKSRGFIPIKVPGVWGSGINFMNAIVNKNPDLNTISYITNSTNCDSALYSRIEKIFERDLRKKLQNAGSVYFIKGQEQWQKPEKPFNFMMMTLLENTAGIHCYCAEEPKFEVWV